MSLLLQGVPVSLLGFSFSHQTSISSAIASRLAPMDRSRSLYSVRLFLLPTPLQMLFLGWTSPLSSGTVLSTQESVSPPHSTFSLPFPRCLYSSHQALGCLLLVFHPPRLSTPNVSDFPPSSRFPQLYPLLSPVPTQSRCRLAAGRPLRLLLATLKQLSFVRLAF
ncbi:hypothetical protein FB451DRAFT_1171298 [Mycena latifolia]|nr:hypothetical protein FB451DRAFT_1171298 [Mycena latifolia]